MSEQPVLSVIVPTVGRPALARAVRSLLRQGDWLPFEVILVGDTHAPNGGPGTWAEQLPSARALAETDPRVRYVEHDGGRHMVGHPQRNFGATVARGRYLWWLGDDDIALPGAFQSLARALHAHEDDPLEANGRVFLFRWIAPWRMVLWHTAGFLAEDHIDAECVVCPNVPARLGTWTNRYQGDFDFIRETADHWGGPERIIWRPEVLALARPGPAEDWTQEGGEATPRRLPVEARAVFVPVEAAG
jgi:glycosyltransferase involved in cell wall biosynthesis